MKLSLIDIYPTANTLQKSISVEVQYELEEGREVVIYLGGVLKDNNGIVLTTLMENPQTLDGSLRSLRAFEANSESVQKRRWETVTTELIATLGDAVLMHISNQLLRNEYRNVNLEMDLICRYLRIDLDFYKQRRTFIPGDNRLGVYDELVPLKLIQEENRPQDILVFSSEKIIAHPFIMNYQRWGGFLFPQDTFGNSNREQDPQFF